VHQKASNILVRCGKPTSPRREDYVPLVGKRKGRQRDTGFTLFGDAEFKERFYDRRDGFGAASGAASSAKQRPEGSATSRGAGGGSSLVHGLP